MYLWPLLLLNCKEFTVRNCQYEQNCFFGSVHSSGQISEPLGGLESLKGASKQQEDAFSVFV